ncbi:MAG: type II secretion system protein GspN [Desulfobacterales bacterium]|jgi:type II secretion system protein N|nr:type II secretion system protein GspN [Desulfobacterales bacterium]
MKKFYLPILYAFYVVAAVIFFIYALFPEEAAKRMVSDRFEYAFPGYSVQIERLAPSFPPGITLKDVTVFQPKKGGVEVPHVRICPSLSRLIRGRLFLHYQGNIQNGAFSGDMEMDADQWHQPKKITLSLSQVHLQNAVLNAIESPPPELTAAVDGHMTFVPNLKTGLTIYAKLALTEVMLTLPALSDVLEPFRFATIDLNCSMAHRILRINNGVFSGPQLEGTMAGTLIFSDPLPKSRLNLRFVVSLRPEYHDKLAQALPVVLFQNKSGNPVGFEFELNGMLEKPSVSISR